MGNRICIRRKYSELEIQAFMYFDNYLWYFRDISISFVFWFLAKIFLVKIRFKVKRHTDYFKSYAIENMITEKM